MQRQINQLRIKKLLKNRKKHIWIYFSTLAALSINPTILSTLAFEVNDVNSKFSSNISIISQSRRKEQVYSDKPHTSSKLSPFYHQSNPYAVIPKSLSLYDNKRTRVSLNANKDGEDVPIEGKKNSSRKEKKKKRKKENDTKGNLVTRFLSKITNNEKGTKNTSKSKQEKRNKKNKNTKLKITLDSEVAIAAALGNRALSDETSNSVNKNTRNMTSSTTDISPSEAGGMEFSIFATVEDNLKEVRNKFNDIRPGATEPYIQEESKKLEQLKIKVEKDRLAKRKRDELERKKQEKMEYEKEQQKILKKKKREKEAQEQKAREQKRKEQKTRQKAIMEAARSKPGNGDKVVKGESINNEDNDISQDDSNTKSNFDPRSIVTGGISNAQNFISNAWDSVFGDDDDDAEWLVACPKTRISPGEVIPIVAGGLDLLLVASKDAKKLHVIANSCPHLGTPLETGPIERRPIEAFKYGSTNASPPALTSVLSPPTSTLQPYKTKGANTPNDDGCEECIVCPLHQTAFALESGEVRGEWCPYPPVIGKVMGSVKPKSKLVTFEVRTRGKNIEVRINTPLNKKDP